MQQHCTGQKRFYAAVFGSDLKTFRLKGHGEIEALSKCGRYTPIFLFHFLCGNEEK